MCVNVKYFHLRLFLFGHPVAQLVGALALQVGRLRLHFPMGLLELLIDIILPPALWPLGSTQPLTEICTRISPGGKGSRCLGLTILSSSCVSTSWSPKCLSRPAVGSSIYYPLLAVVDYIEHGGRQFQQFL